MIGDGDDRFEVRLGRLRSASGSRRATGFFERVSKAAKSKRRGGGGGRRSSSARQMAFQRRVVIKASIKRMAGHGFSSFRNHLDYIQRDGTDARGDRAEPYGRGVDESAFSRDASDSPRTSTDFAERCKDDRHHFRFVVAPEDSATLQDLPAFSRDLVEQMENDLGTRLDWVATDHYDTGQPHTHLVVRGMRDDGKDLVIPRRYISQGLRERAQSLVELELGPVSQIEGRLRLSRTVEAKRYTLLDRALSSQMDDGVIDMRGPVQKGRVWYRQLQVRRLQALSRMGLADRLGSGRWQVRPDFAETLRVMGERGDIIKAVHRSLVQGDPEVDPSRPQTLITERNRFDPNGKRATELTGVVQQFGQPDDRRAGGFVIIQSLDGAPVYASVAEDEIFETLRKGQVVTFQPHPRGARAIDRSIAAFAAAHNGIYSEARHVTEGEWVSPAYAQAHVRRLEALRRKNLMTRYADGSWRIPPDYLDRASQYEADRTQKLPTPVQRDSRLTLQQMEGARGATWLDRHLVRDGLGSLLSDTISEALDKRVETLRGMGFAIGSKGELPEGALQQLETGDLREAAAKLEPSIGKPYAAVGTARQVDGIYRQSVEQPSGKYAVIERAKDFTLVPWRPVMDQRLGQSISGRVSGGGISWDVTSRKVPSR